MNATQILHDARAAVEDLAGRLGELLRDLPAADAAVSPRWSIRDAAAHLICGTSLSAELATGTPSPVGDVSPEGMARFNAQRIADIVDTEPGVLAKSLVGAVGQLLAATDGRSGETPVTWHTGLTVDLSQLAGILVGEYVLHGFDIATAAGVPWPVAAEHAALTLYGYGPVNAASVDPATSRGHTATYDIDVGVAGRFAVRFVDGQVTFGPPGEHPADCGITADPVAFLLVSTGRMSRWTAIALGLMRADGRRPELAASFGNLFRFP